MSFRKLRLLLHQEPCKKLWNEICRLFETWSEDNIEVAVDYANQHMEHWPIELRHVEHFRGNHKFPPWWKLARSIRFFRSRKVTKLPRVFEKMSSHFENIRVLDLSDCRYLENINELRNLTELRTLLLNSCFELKNIRGLRSLKKLETLEMRDCGRVESGESLTFLPSLSHLDVSGCWGIGDAQFLSSLPHLQFFAASRCSWLKTLQPLQSCASLRTLQLLSCNEIEDIEVLIELGQLEHLSLTSERLPSQFHWFSSVLEGEFLLEFLDSVRDYYSV